MTADFLVTAFVTLFVVIDPIGTTPIFVALTRGMAPARRHAIARRACVIGLVILAAFGLFGEALLGFVGISMPAFRIAGGLLLFLTALEMLFGRRTERRSSQAGTSEEDDDEDDTPEDDPSVFPLAIPLLAGPGSIASLILLMDQSGGTPLTLSSLFAVIALIYAICYLLFRAAGPIERGLGPTGILVVTRLLGMLLAALSVQFVLDGIANAGLSIGP
ncbi:MarC family protein [Palleronia sp. THAF1]|uniref:MarC family protein n=1 Tax=Palleronia sp. THAF1 TaxID=2587842 RepID=UPI000F529E57|nr:MarC family protein [Palleronia sp. THAF1]